MNLNLHRQSRQSSRSPRTYLLALTARLLCAFVCLLATDAFVANVAAQGDATPVPTAISDNRYLFVVDTSSKMKRHANDVLKTVGELIHSGANGQMRAGDTIGLWTFNQDVYSDFPLQPWGRDGRDQLASRTIAFLKQQHFEKTSQFDKLLPDLFEVIKASDVITIIIISDGDGKMKGSPFDDEINTLYRQTLKDMKGKRTPVVTVLEAKGGKIFRYTVNALPWPVVIPEVPISKPVAHAHHKPPVEAAPESVTPKPVVPAKPVPPLIIEGNYPPPVAAPPVVVPAPTPAPAPPVAVNQTVETNKVGNPPGPAAPVEKNASLLTNPAPIVPEKASETAPAVASTPQENAATNHPLAVIAPEVGGRAKNLLIAALILALTGAVLIILMLLRSRSNSGPSLITHSMSNRKK